MKKRIILIVQEKIVMLKSQSSKIFYYKSDIDCKSCGCNFSCCVISGQSIFLKEYIKCSKCKHRSLTTEITTKKIKNCMLCHTKLNMENKESNKI